MKMFRIVTAFLLVCALRAVPVFTGYALVDPNIPDGEKIKYISTVEGKSAAITEETHIKTEGDRTIYEITSFSESEDRQVKIEKEAMRLLSVHAVTKYSDGSVDSMQIFNEKKDAKENEIRLANFLVLRYVLRGFPFRRVNNLKVVGFGQGKQGDFGMKVKFLKEEKVKVRGGAFHCYRLEFVTEGFWAIFFPKTNLWYSTEAPHYLVRYEGPFFQGGSPKTLVIELVEYSKNN